MGNPDKIRVLAMRILDSMESFEAAAGPTEGVGEAIGVYDAGDGTVPLWVSTEGVVRDSERTTLRYDSMVEVHAPRSKSRGDVESARIKIVMDNGTDEVVDVAGGRGRFCDSFEFARFLSRAARLSRES